MRAEPMQVQNALEQGLALPFALVRSLSQVTLGPAPDAVNLEELLEARFFNAQEEIRIFQGEDGLQAARLLEDSSAAVLCEVRPVSNPMFGTEVTLCHELDFDGDGQARVIATRMTGWKGGTTDG